MIVDRVEAVLPKENITAPGGAIRKQIIAKGFSWDNRPLSNEDIKELYFNTKDDLLLKGIMVKAKIGHYQEEQNTEDGQKLKGFVTSLELQEQPYENDFEMSIWADIHLYPEVYKDFGDGRYPEVSIGDSGKTVLKDKDGNDMGKIIEHVALLGAQRAAVPHLKQQIKSFYSKILAITNKKSNKESKSMDEDFRKSLLAMRDLITAMLKGSSSSDGGGSDGGKANDKPDPKKEDEEEEKETKTKSISMAEATKAFSKLVSDGHLVNDDRPSYDELLERVPDIDFAVKHFSKRNVITPPTGEKTKSDRDESELSEEHKRVKETLRNMGHDPDSEKYKAVADKSYADLKEEGQ